MLNLMCRMVYAVASEWPRSDVFQVRFIAGFSRQVLILSDDPSALDAGVKLRPTADELAAIGPAFTEKWKEYYENAPDKPVMWIGPVSMSVSTTSEFLAC